MSVWTDFGLTEPSLSSDGAPDAVDALAALLESVQQVAINVVKEGGAAGDGVADDYEAIQDVLDAIPDGGGVALFPAGMDFIHSDTLVPKPGTVMWTPMSATRWRGGPATRLLYTGSDAAVRVTATAAIDVYDSLTIRGLVIDGNDATGSADGVVLEVTDGSAVEGVLLDEVAIVNFPSNQFVASGEVFDFTARRCSFHNYQRVGIDAGDGGDLIVGSFNSQATFDDCWFYQYKTGQWSYNGGGVDTRFINGTVANESGCNGLSINGGLTLIGTHIEGVGATGVGIRRWGAQAATILPGSLANYATGVQVGTPDSTASAANGTTIGGYLDGNTTDVSILAGGSRRGTLILPLGTTSAVITNNRRTTDGVIGEVVNLANVTTPTITGSRTDGTAVNNALNELQNLGFMINGSS